MHRCDSLFTGLTALSLSLGLLAGCAAPMPVAPSTVTPGADAPAAAAPEPSAPGSVGTPVVATPAAAATTLSGTATFRGEPLASYRLSVLDARTGEAVALVDDLAKATGLAVLNRNLKTDARGAFSLQVAGLAPGQALRVQAASGNAVLETVVTGDGQALGQPAGYRVRATGGLVINELSTAIASVARSVLLTTMVLPADKAAPVIAQLNTTMNKLAAQLDTHIKANPGVANTLVTPKEAAAAVQSLVSQANALKTLTQEIAGLVSRIAKEGAADPAAQARLSGLVFVGTVLSGDFKNGAFTLTNTLNGAAVDASTGNLTTVTSQTSSTASSGGSSAPVIVGKPVATATELFAALADTTVETIALTADITLPQLNAYRVKELTLVSVASFLTIDRAVTINGYGKTLTAHDYTQIKVEGVTIKNLTTNRGVQVPYYSGIGKLTLDNVTFENADQGSAVVSMYASGAGSVINKCTFNGGAEGVLFKSGTVTNCTFNGFTNSAIRYQEASTISGNRFNLAAGGRGVQFESSDLHDVATIAEVKNNIFTPPATGAAPYAFYFQQSFASLDASTAAQNALLAIAAGNTFGSLASEARVYAGQSSVSDE